MIVSQAWSYLRLLDRARGNDAVRAVLAPLAVGIDLDNIVARQGLARAIVQPASDTAVAVVETDAQLLRRYLLSFDRASAGSRDGYLFRGFSAWPGMGDMKGNGQAVHGRSGDVDLVVMGPDGRAATDDELALVRASAAAARYVPEGIGVYLRRAARASYAVDLTLVVREGPSPDLVTAAARARIESAARFRTVIGGSIPPGLFSGVAYDDNVVSVTDNAPVAIAADPYGVPVMTGVTLTATVA